MNADLRIPLNPRGATPPRPRGRSRRPARRRPTAEWLESRHLPAVALPGIDATDPPDGSMLSRAPQVLAVTLDPAVVGEVESLLSDFFSIPPDQALSAVVAMDYGRDFEIDRVDADGTTTPVAGGSLDALPESVATATSADGTTRTQIIVDLPTGLDLGPGSYQLAVVPGSTLSDVFGLVTDPTWYTPTAGTTGSIPIAGFTVTGRGPTLADATDLETIGASTRTVVSTLDPSEVGSSVAFYRITLPAGGDWQLNADVLTNAIGSPTTTAISLFGPDGQLLATRGAGTGSASDPLDPELIRDLPGGTYYLGVSGARNLPGTSDGYDPMTGAPGVLDANDPAGPYELEVSATAVTPPTQLVGFTLDHADPRESSPTGLDLTFSGPVDATPLSVPDQVLTALEVVDASGKVWPISYMTSDQDQAGQERLSFVFDGALPAGTYSLIDPAQGGLTDLAGRPIVGPGGGSSDVLATWTVAASRGPGDPSDLGVLWPGALNVSWVAPITGTVAVSPGRGLDDRFTVIVPGVYELQTQVPDGSIDVRIASADGSTSQEADHLGGLSDFDVYLNAGTYSLSLSADGSQPVSVAWALRPLSLDYEKIPTNGVGMSSSLTFGLVETGPGGGSSSGTSATATATAGGIPGSSGASSGLSAPLTAMESGPAGLPSPGDFHAAAVGPLADGASIALADAGRGLPAGLVLSSSSGGTDPRVGEGDAAPNGAGLASRDVGPEAASARADAKAMILAQADPLVQIAGWFAGQVPAPAALPVVEPGSPATGPGTTMLAAASAPGDDADGNARGPRRETLAQADLGLPLALLVGTAVTYRLSRPVNKWWRRRHGAHPEWPRPHGFARAGRTTVPRT